VGRPVRRSHARYSQHFPQQAAPPPLAALAAQHLHKSLQLPPSALLDHLQRLWLGQLQPSSWASVSSKVRKYLAFCTQHGAQPVPCSEPTMLLFIAWLSWEGAVSAEYFPQYVSAVRSLHKFLFLTPPAASVAVSAVLRAAVVAQRSAEATLPKHPLPAVHITAAVSFGLATHDLSALRLCVFVVLKFLFGVRGATISALRTDDIGWSTSQRSVTCIWVAEKQRHGAPDHRSVTIRFPMAPAVLRLLDVYHDRAQPGDSFWAVAPLGPMPSASAAFQQFLSLLSISPPDGARFTGHSTRSGFVTAVRSLSIPLEVAASVAGWSLNSFTRAAVYKYLRVLLPADNAAYTLFAGLFDPVTLATAKRVFKALPL
jgi:hypothetical protein